MSLLTEVTPEMAQRVLDRRGYIVINSRHSQAVGDTIERISCSLAGEDPIFRDWKGSHRCGHGLLRFPGAMETIRPSSGSLVR